MCFLSVYRLKSIISIGIVATLFIGISLLYILVYAFVISSVTAQVQATFRNIFIGGFLVSSVLMILSSLLGIIGLIRKRNGFIVIYAITMFVYFLCFLVLAIFVIQYPNQLINDCNDNIQNDYTKAVVQANKTLCKTCECNFNNQKAYSTHQMAILQSMGFTNYSENVTNPVNAQNCQGWSNKTYPVTQEMIMIETFFNCSGWCDVDPSYNLYYFFSSVNDGIPNTTCVNAMLAFFQNFGRVIEISSFSVSSVLFFILITIFCLCCHPERGQQYDAMTLFKTSFLHHEEEDSLKEDIDRNSPQSIQNQ